MKVVSTADRLREIMAEQGLKQVDIIERAKPVCESYGIKLNKSDISQYLSGKVEPGQFKLMALAYALNVSEYWLMGFDVPRGKSSIISKPHAEFNSEVMYALQILASKSDYEISIYANQYQIRKQDCLVTISRKELQDYVQEAIRLIDVLTKETIARKFRDDIVPLSSDYTLPDDTLLAARNNSIDTPGELEKTMIDLSELKRPE